MAPKGFVAVRQAVLAALQRGDYQHEARGSIDVKNLLATGEVSPEQVMAVIRRCNGTQHECTPHHRMPKVECHVIRSQGWYVKFYFLDPVTVFISVHPSTSAS